MRTLEECRAALDRVDAQLVALLEERMCISREVAACKLAAGQPVLDAAREAQVITSRTAQLRDGTFAPALRAVYEQIMAVSRQEQQRLIDRAGEDA